MGRGDIGEGLGVGRQCVKSLEGGEETMSGRAWW